MPLHYICEGKISRLIYLEEKSGKWIDSTSSKFEKFQLKIERYSEIKEENTKEICRKERPERLNGVEIANFCLTKIGSHEKSLNLEIPIFCTIPSVNLLLGDFGVLECANGLLINTKSNFGFTITSNSVSIEGQSLNSSHIEKFDCEEI